MPKSSHVARTIQSDPALCGRILKLANASVPEGGLLVQQAKGPAAKAGLRAGDVIVAVNGQPTRTVDELRKQVGDAKGKLAVLIEREGQRVFVPVELS